MRHFKSSRPWRACTLIGLAVLALPLIAASQSAGPSAVAPIRELPEAGDPRALAVTDYLQGRAAHLLGWLPDGSLLIRTRFGDTDQVHRVRTPLGMREQLTFGRGILTAEARPYSSDTVALLEPRAGGERSQLLLQTLSPLRLVPLTDGSALDGAPLWAHDGRRLAFTSQRTDSTDVGVYLLDIAAAGAVAATPVIAAPRLIAGGAGVHWQLLDWSLDDRYLLLGRVTGDADTDLYRVDATAGQIEPVMLNAPTGKVAPSSERRTGERRRKVDADGSSGVLSARTARFASDGRGILVLTRARMPAVTAHGGATAVGQSEYLRLAELDPNSGTLTDLSADADHDVERFAESPDGHYLAYALNDDGTSRLMLTDRQRKLDLSVGDAPRGIIDEMRFDTQGQRLALSIESARGGADLYVLEPATHALTRWTASEAGPIDATAFVTPQLVHFPTWDRVDGQERLLPALVYAAAASAVPRPVVILLCSGSHTQFRPRFDPFAQYLAGALGAIVIAPAVRGSSGYGLAFENLGAGALREDAARDVGALLVWIGLQPTFDRAHVAVLGEGYGAYLALQSLAEYGDRLVGAVAAFPPHLAPLTPLLAIRQPALLVQGLNDPVAPASELQQLRARLRADGARIEYLGVPDEGARFTRQADREMYYEAAADFLLRTLH